MTLKDAAAQLRTVCFRSDARKLGFDPEDGMQVIAAGRLAIYEPYGQFQLIANVIEKSGAGRLELAFRALKEKLQSEGLFDAKHKQPLPRFPFRIGVITSPTGAAVRDIVSTIRRRWPCAEIVLAPVRVQGEQASGEIAAALDTMATAVGIDVVIVGRGGGSLEDLWAFNEENVARAVFTCPVPVISAVGHESDFTIIDFTADVRAATPTMAGEIAVPQRDEVLKSINEASDKIVYIIRNKLDLHSARLGELLKSYAMGQIRGRIEKQMQRLDFAAEKLLSTMLSLISTKRNELIEKTASMKSMSPKGVLQRGFSLCTHPGTGHVLSSAGAALEAGRLRITFRDGRIKAEAKEEDNG